jgi:phage gp36-like protein
MTDALAIAPHPLATEATDGVGASVDIGTQRSCLKLDLLVDSMTATKLTVSVEHSPSTSGPWALLGPLFPVTAPVVRSALMIKSKRFVRVTWALTGGGNASFQVTGEAHTLYATPTDVNTFAFPEKVSESLPNHELIAACLASTDEAASYMTSFNSPKTAWGDALTMHVAKMAGYRIMARRGFQPGGSDDLIVKGYDDAIKWLTAVAKGTINPPGDSGDGGDGSGNGHKNDARVWSKESARGW